MRVAIKESAAAGAGSGQELLAMLHRIRLVLVVARAVLVAWMVARVKRAAMVSAGLLLGALLPSCGGRPPASSAPEGAGSGSVATGAPSAPSADAAGTPSSAQREPCAPQDARFAGKFARACCQEPPRWRWNGRGCEPFWLVEACHCARCVGADCGKLFPSEPECRAAYAACPGVAAP